MSMRSKSLGRQGKSVLPPVANGDDRRLSNSKNLRTVSRSNADLPSTSTPPIAVPNGRMIPIGSMSSSAVGPRSIFTKRGSYGRSENNEILLDVKDQLLEAKKKIAELNQKNKVLNTQLNRTKRESERREAHLQSIMAGRFQPAEMNDTHLAMTLASFDHQRLENEQIINAQADRIKKLEQKLELADMGNYEHDDSEVEDEQEEELGSSMGSHNGHAKGKTKVPEEWMQKHRKKLEIARAHIEQNKELKEKIKELTAELHETKQKKLKEIHTNARVNTADVNRIMNRIQENGLLRQQVDVATKNLKHELEEKNREIESLKKQLEALMSEKGDGTFVDELEYLRNEKQRLENERDEMRSEHVLRELEKEQLSNVIADLEDEKRTIDEERDEWTKTKIAFDKVQITLEREMRQMEEVIDNLRKDNALLRKKLAHMQNQSKEDIMGNHVDKGTEKSYASEKPSSSPPRPKNIPRLDMRDMSAEITSPESPSVNSHASEKQPDSSAQWDERINYLNHSLVAHLIRQDALFTAQKEFNEP